MIPTAPSLHQHNCRRFRPFSPYIKRSGIGKQNSRKYLSIRAGSGSSGSRSPFQGNYKTWQQVGTWLATTAFAVALSYTCVTQSVLAVTNEQLLFLEAWRAVDRAYYDKNFNGKSWFRIREQYMKDKQLQSRPETYAAIRALLAELDDPFTRFLEPSRYAALKRGTAGSLTGVGLEVGFDMGAGSDSDLVVITPSADGPADKAGIKPRDQVVAIDGKPTKGTSLYDAGELLQGPEGSQVTLTIKSADDSEPRDVPLQRQRIINNPVSSQLCQRVPLGEVADQSDNFGKVGYIRVATFSKQTTDNVKTALHKLQAEKASMVILDIRNNGGGLFPAGVEVARTFLNDGDIVLIADSQGVRDSYPASNVAVEPSKPLSVLVNRGTASASEVLAGALQDNGRAKIVGEKTFGKGLIQTIVELSDGSGVAVTVARYQTPLGTDINKKGIQPDILIDNGDMPPTNGPGFCKYISNRGAAVLFDAKAAAKMPKGPEEKRADGLGESMPIDVTQYENAYISGQPAESSKGSKDPEAAPAAAPTPSGDAPGSSSQPEANPQEETSTPSTTPNGSEGTPADQAPKDSASPVEEGSKSQQPAEVPEDSGRGAKPSDSPDQEPKQPQSPPSASDDAAKQPSERPILDQPASVEEIGRQTDDSRSHSPAEVEITPRARSETAVSMPGALLGDDAMEPELQFPEDPDTETPDAVLMPVPLDPSNALATPESGDWMRFEFEESSVPTPVPTA